MDDTWHCFNPYCQNTFPKPSLAVILALPDDAPGGWLRLCPTCRKEKYPELSFEGGFDNPPRAD